MSEPRYKAIVDDYIKKIRSGALPPGTRLPTHRVLAKEKGVALVTASRVYQELEKIGLVSGEAGRGTFVRETELAPGHGIDQPERIEGALDLNFNSALLSDQVPLLRQGLRQLAASGELEALLHYQPHGGRMRDRTLIADYVKRHGVFAEPEHLLIVSGAQHGLSVALESLFRPGDVIIADQFTYSGFKVAAKERGIEMVAMPSTASGPDLSVLEPLCERRRVSGLYLMPTLHNPMGWVLSLSQRKKLVAVARKYDLTIIEDGAYAFLHEKAPATIASMAPERTLYVSGFSKSAATGLRVGYVTAPEDWIPGLERAIRISIWNTPALMVALLCQWIQDGTLARLESGKRLDAAIRQKMAQDELAEYDLTGHPNAYHLWLQLPEEVRADRVVAALKEEKVLVSTAEPFTISAHVPHALRLALGLVTIKELQGGLGVIKKTISDLMYL